MFEQRTFSKMYSWLLVLVFLMARGGPGAKRRRSSVEQQEEHAAERSGSEYNPGDDSGDESQGEDWEVLQATIEAKRAELVKGKGKEKMKEKSIRSQKKSGGVKLHELVISSSSSDSLIPTFSDESTDWERCSLYSSKYCICERFVDIRQLLHHVPQLNFLLQNGDLHEACNFCEKSGYSLELVQEFYMQGGNVEDEEGGPYSFQTRVRGVDCKVTPDLIGAALGIESEIFGNDYLTSGFDSVRDWLTVMRTLTLPNTRSNGLTVKSKDLKIEYRFLNLIVCYNVMPLMNTKVVQWDRMLYMYLLANPELVRQRKINLNVPFLIWRRMARDVLCLGLTKRLSFPLLIMRLLDLFGIDTTCSVCKFGRGPVTEATFAKSLDLCSTEGMQGTQNLKKPSSSQAAASMDDSAAVHYHSLLCEMTRLSGEVAELRRMIQVIFDRLGCALPSHVTPPPPGAGPS